MVQATQCTARSFNGYRPLSVAVKVAAHNGEPLTRHHDYENCNAAWFGVSRDTRPNAHALTFSHISLFTSELHSADLVIISLPVIARAVWKSCTAADTLRAHTEETRTEGNFTGRRG